MAISRSLMERQLRAGGGLMTLEEPRQGYFLGKIVRKAKRAVKKVVKSPLGKAALLGAAAYGLGGAKFLGGQGIFSGGQGLARFANLKNLFLPAASNPLGKRGLLAGLAFDDKGQFSLGRAALSGLGATALAAPFLMGGGEDEEEVDDTPFSQTPDSIANIVSMARNQDPSLRFLPKPKFVDNFYAADGGLASIPRDGYRFGNVVQKASSAMKNIKNALVTKLGRMTDDVEITTMSDFAEDTGASMDLSFVAKSKKGKETLDGLVQEGILDVSEGIYTPKAMMGDDAILGMDKLKASGVIEEGGNFKRFDQGAGEGEYGMPYAGYEQLIETFGRQKKAEGGLMDLGGLEKDYREGGFVPLGAEERADDVPARLSKNEFVFTADAVRNAGGGDIDKGAEVMQNMMDNLEAGGTISEESQGMNPAQEMFDQAQMLEGRLA